MSRIAHRSNDASLDHKEDVAAPAKTEDLKQQVIIESGYPAAGATDMLRKLPAPKLRKLTRSPF